MRTGERGGAQRGRFGHREHLERLVERVSEELAIAGAQAASAEETQFHSAARKRGLGPCLPRRFEW